MCVRLCATGEVIANDLTWAHRELMRSMQKPGVNGQDSAQGTSQQAAQCVPPANFALTAVYAIRSRAHGPATQADGREDLGGSGAGGLGSSGAGDHVGNSGWCMPHNGEPT